MSNREKLTCRKPQSNYYTFWCFGETGEFGKVMRFRGVNSYWSLPLTLIGLHGLLGLKMLMWKTPYTHLLLLLTSPSWYQTICFGILCAVLASLVMWFVYRRRLRKAARAIRLRDERLAQRALMARELFDTQLQTIEAGTYLADDALERPNDIAHMRGALETISRWLGQAAQEGQKALKLLTTITVEKHDN